MITLTFFIRNTRVGFALICTHTSMSASYVYTKPSSGVSSQLVQCSEAFGHWTIAEEAEGADCRARLHWWSSYESQYVIVAAQGLRLI